MTTDQTSLEKAVEKLVLRITAPFPNGHFKDTYISIFKEELFTTIKANFSEEQQEKYVDIASFLEEIGPQKYSEIQAGLQGRILKRLVEAGFNE